MHSSRVLFANIPPYNAIMPNKVDEEEPPVEVVPNFTEESEFIFSPTSRMQSDYGPIFELDEKVFVEAFRMRKTVFHEIYKDIWQKFTNPQTNIDTPIISKLAIFLGTLAPNYSRRIETSILRHLKVSRSIVSDVVKECLPIFEKCFVPKWISMPLMEERIAAKIEFRRRFKIPGVIGCIGGKHFQIQSPHPELDRLYKSHGGFNSLNVMIVCDQNCMIRFVDARHPGANSNHFIWSTSNVFLEPANAGSWDDDWLIGDATYHLSKHMLTPFRNPIDDHQLDFNWQMRIAHLLIKRCFLLIKDRFGVCVTEDIVYLKPDRASRMINICCAVHNACIHYQSECEPMENDGNIKMDYRNQATPNHININDALEAIHENVSLAPELNKIRNKIAAKL